MSRPTRGYKTSSDNNEIKLDNDSNINTVESNEMLFNLIKISGNQEVYNDLKEQTSKIKQLLSQSKEKIENINLYENKILNNEIYKWNNLFNKSIPISSYVSSFNSIKLQLQKNEENKNEILKNDIEKEKKMIFKHENGPKKYLFIPSSKLPRSRLRGISKKLKMKQMLSRKDNDLYIENKYLSLSAHSNNIQPLMSLIHAQLHPGEDDELIKHKKVYIKTNKPLGSEKDINDIDYTINHREYQRNELNRLKLRQLHEKSSVSNLILPEYNSNDPDLDIFKKAKLLENIIKEQYDNESLDKEDIFDDEGFQELQNNNKVMLDEKEREKNIYYQLLNLDNNNQNIRAQSARRGDSVEQSQIKKSSMRAMSANPLRKKNRKENLAHIPYRTKIGPGSNIKKKSLQFEGSDEGKSSQYSTYEEVNDKQNSTKYSYKKKQLVPNKIYQKINMRLKEKQFEKDKNKLEQFSKLIKIDDAFLSEDLKLDSNNSNDYVINSNTKSNGVANIDKNKIRPSSAFPMKNGKIPENLGSINSNTMVPITPKKVLSNTIKNNFRRFSKKNSLDNTKSDFNTSTFVKKNNLLINTKSKKVNMFYFNDIIETKNQKIYEMRPIIRNDNIFVGTNYFNRTRPQILNNKNKLILDKKELKRVQSGQNLKKMSNMEDNMIIQEENLEVRNNSLNNNYKGRKRIVSARI